MTDVGVPRYHLTDSYDAFLLLSFGGPEGSDEVMPFLRNVTAGRGIPQERLEQVAKHYQHFGGVSPINDQNRALLAALRDEFTRSGIDLPIYWGNRNWHPMLADTVQQMTRDGVRRAICFVTSAYGGYSGCRQYQQDIAQARQVVGERAPAIDKIRHYFNHPGFLDPMVDSVANARESLGVDRFGERVRLVFTAHSIPTSMATNAGPDGDLYVTELRAAAGLVADAAGAGTDWDLVWQSRSGPPMVPWLAPDINEHLRAVAAEGVRSVVVAPIGFVSDHLEVVWDLDHEVAETAKELGLFMARAATAGTDPRFVSMVAELVAERIDASVPHRSVGPMGPSWDRCAAGCCPAPRRPQPLPDVMSETVFGV